jgi:hypothetical protein
VDAASGVWCDVDTKPNIYDEDVVVPAGVNLILPLTAVVCSVTSTGGTISASPPTSRDYVNVPYQGVTMVALHSDDISKEWVTPTTPWVDAVLGGGDSVSPALYCARRGIPMTHGVINALIGDATHMSINDMRYLAHAGGCEFVSQSYNHSTVDINTALMETLGSRDHIKSLSAAFSTPPTGFMEAADSGTNAKISSLIQRLGFPCRGFSNPGNWNADASTYLVNLDVREGYLGRLLQSVFQWRITYGNTQGYNNGPLSIADTEVGWWALSAFDPAALSANCRYLVLFDGPTAAGLQTKIDALYTAMLAGTVVCITDSTLINGIIQPAETLGGTYDPAFTVTAEGNLPTSTISGWYTDTVTKGVCTATNTIELSEGYYLKQDFNVPPGQSLRLKINAKGNAAGAIIRPYVQYIYSVGGVTKMLAEYMPDIILTDADATYYGSFASPDYARRGTLGFKNVSTGGKLVTFSSVYMSVC